MEKIIYYKKLCAGVKYPIYGTQWHPEKNPFFWDSRYHVNHSLEGIKGTQYMANFFMQEGKLISK